MADQTLEQLRVSNPPGTVTGTELIYASQGGDATALTINEIAAALAGIVSATTYDAPYRGARVSLTADKTGLSYPYIVSWDQADRDTDGFWSAGDPTRLTVPAGVTKVRVRTSLRLTTGIFDGFLISMYKNGGYEPGMSIVNNRFVDTAGDNFANNEAQVFSDVLDVAEGDYFEARVTSTDASYDSVQENDRTWFAIEVVEVVAP
jgi:hypothetical protein